ncbi:MAG: hypothetical protein MHMPM18_001408 [Marteilia pararefringens]
MIAATLCTICSSSIRKCCYKCPRCATHFCSAPCYKTHKCYETSQGAAPSLEQLMRDQSYFDTIKKNLTIASKNKLTRFERCPSRGRKLPFDFETLRIAALARDIEYKLELNSLQLLNTLTNCYEKQRDIIKWTCSFTFLDSNRIDLVIHHCNESNNMKRILEYILRNPKYKSKLKLLGSESKKIENFTLLLHNSNHDNLKDALESTSGDKVDKLETKNDFDGQKFYVREMNSTIREILKGTRSFVINDGDSVDMM